MLESPPSSQYSRRVYPMTVTEEPESESLTTSINKNQEGPALSDKKYLDSPKKESKSCQKDSIKTKINIGKKLSPIATKSFL